MDASSSCSPMRLSFPPFLIPGPEELLDHILSFMCVPDVIALRDAVSYSRRYGGLSRRCTARLSTREFIQTHIGNADAIIVAMSRSVVLLSGSLSAEFFVPGSSTPSSDIDFFMHNDPLRISEFVRATERHAGIVWRTPIRHLEWCMENGRGRVTVPRQTSVTLLQNNDIRQIVVSAGCRLAPIEHQGTPASDDDKFVLEVNGKEVCAKLVRPHEEYMPHVEYIIHGTVCVRGRHREVQLMVQQGRDAHCLDFLFHFHSTCVQSFITAHTACHMHAEQSCERRLYRWQNNVRTVDNRNALAKYLDRGYSENATIDLPSRGFRIRISDDSMCARGLRLNWHILPAYLNGDIMEYYTQECAGMVWCENKWGCKEVYVPLGSRGVPADTVRHWFSNDAQEDVSPEQFGIKTSVGHHPVVAAWRGE